MSGPLWWGLPNSVGAQQAEHLGPIHGEIDALERLGLPEAFDEKGRDGEDEERGGDEQQEPEGQVDKPTLFLDGETLVDRHVRQAMLAGIEKSIVVTNDTNERTITDALADARQVAEITVTRQVAPDAEGAIVAGLERTTEATQW